MERNNRAMLPEEPSSLHNVCPRCFNQNDWPIFSSEGRDFYTAYFFEHPWYDGWHEVVGGALGARVRRHPSHDLWREEASQGHVQRWNIPEVTGFMRQLHREPCNYIRFQRYVMDGTMYLTQLGDAALALILKNCVPKFEAAGYKKVPQHWRIASRNDTLSSIMAYLNIDFGCGKDVRRTGNAAEAYIFCMLESAHGGDTAAAENLFFIAMYAMFLAYDPWLNLT